MRRAWRGRRFSFEGEFYRCARCRCSARARGSSRIRRFAWPRPAGRPSRGSAPRGFPSSSAFAGDSLDELAAQLAALPRGVARRRPPRRSERLPPPAPARGGDRRRRARGGARHPRSLLQAPERARGERRGPPGGPARLPAPCDGRPPRLARLRRHPREPGDRGLRRATSPAGSGSSATFSASTGSCRAQSGRAARRGDHPGEPSYPCPGGETRIQQPGGPTRSERIDTDDLGRGSCPRHRRLPRERRFARAEPGPSPTR